MTTLSKLKPGDWFSMKRSKAVWMVTDQIGRSPSGLIRGGRLVVDLATGKAEHLPGDTLVRKQASVSEEIEAAKVADPSYVPTVEEAARHPKEFVDGFTEQVAIVSNRPAADGSWRCPQCGGFTYGIDRGVIECHSY